MDSEIAKLYRTELEHLRNFMEGDVQRSKRMTSAWSDEEKALQVQRNPFCRTCDEKLTLQNITREHIHPLCLGGFENPKNVIPMCKKCNFARNEVMKDAIGFVSSNAILKRWPANKRSVESFLVWTFATINGDRNSVNYFSELNGSFSKHRGKQIARKTTQTETRISNPPEPKSRFSKLKIFAKSLVDRTKKPSKTVTEKITCVCGVILRYDPSKLTNSKAHYKCPKCEHKITLDLPQSKFEDNSKKSLLKAKAKPKTATPKDKSVVTKIARASIVQAGSEFPKLTRINTRSGLKLPREPSEMAKIIHWLFVNDLKNKTWSELKEDLSGQSFITTTPTQLHSTLIKITMWVKPDGDLQSEDFFQLQQKKSEIGLEGLFSVVENICLAHKKIEDSDFDNIRLYFNEVRKSLPHGRFSKFVISKLSETGKIDLGALSKPHLDEFIESEGFSTLTELKSTMGYSRNSKLKKIIEDLCGSRVKFTLDPNNEKKIFIELSD